MKYFQKVALNTCFVIGNVLYQYIKENYFLCYILSSHHFKNVYGIIFICCVENKRKIKLNLWLLKWTWLLSYPFKTTFVTALHWWVGINIAFESTVPFVALFPIFRILYARFYWNIRKDIYFVQFIFIFCLFEITHTRLL